MPPFLRISRRAADRLRGGHLWVYRSDVEQDPGDLEPGELVTVTDSRLIPLGTALYSSASQIAGRLVSRQPGISRDLYLGELRERLRVALRLRLELAAAELRQHAYPHRQEMSDLCSPQLSNAQRLVFAEADNLPGIVVDRYNDICVVQFLTQGTAKDDVREAVVAALRDELSPSGEPLTILERPDPRIRQIEQLAPSSEDPLFTTIPDQPPSTTIFQLNGLRFRYAAAAGQKTGAFLDQRLNYDAAARHVFASSRRAGNVQPRRALDVCTYHGGFALHLARVCDHVTGIDQSRAALEGADANLALNSQIDPEHVDWVEADAFELLRALDDANRSNAALGNLPIAPGLFDAIVLDPPAFAKSKRAMEGALRGYKEMNLRAMRLLAPGGTLITCSCSHHVSLADFTSVIASAAADAGRRVQLFETRGAAPDHPEVLTLAETRYLKCLICRVD